MIDKAITAGWCILGALSLLIIALLLPAINLAFD